MICTVCLFTFCGCGLIDDADDRLVFAVDSELPRDGGMPRKSTSDDGCDDDDVFVRGADRDDFFAILTFFSRVK